MTIENIYMHCNNITMGTEFSIYSLETNSVIMKGIHKDIPKVIRNIEIASFAFVNANKILIYLK